VHCVGKALALAHVLLQCNHTIVLRLLPERRNPDGPTGGARPPPTSHFSIQIAETGSVFLLVVSFN